MRTATILVTLVLALGAGGCTGGNWVTEKDKELNWQTHQALQQVNHFLAALGSIGLPAPLVEVFPRAAQAAKDAEENVQTRIKSHGEPKEKKPYSAEASAAARKDSTASHSMSWWKVGGIGILTLLGTTMANRFAPGLGGIISKLAGGLFDSQSTKVAKANTAAMEQYLRDNPEASGTLEKYAARAQEALGVKSFASKLLNEVKKAVLPDLPTRPPEGVTAGARPATAPAEPPQAASGDADA